MRAKHPAILPFLVRAVAACLVVLMAAVASADATFLMNGQGNTNLVFESFVADRDGGNFFYRLVGTKGKLEGKQSTLLAVQVLSIEFRDPDDTEKEPKGRVANLTLKDGKVVNHLTLERFLRSKTGAFCRFRKVGVPPGGKTIDVALDTIQAMEIAPAPVTLNDDPVIESEFRKVHRSGDIANVLEQAPAEPEDTSAAAAPAAPTEPMSSDEQFSKMIGADKVYGDNNPLTEGTKKKKKKGPFDLGDAKTGDAILALGMFMIACLLGGVVLLTFVTGTFVLLFSAKSCGIKDLTVPRAIATSALLAVVPPGLFFGCLFIPFINCSLKLTMGIFLWWLSAKLIVGGMLSLHY